MSRILFSAAPPRRILISAQMGIGNLIMFLPFLRALRKGYPEAHIAAIFSEKNGADELLASLAAGLVNEIVQLDLKGVGRFGRFWSGVRLGLRGWDLAVFRFNGFKREVMTAAAVGRAGWRLGHATSPDWLNRWNRILNIPVVMRPGDHEVDRYLQLAEEISLPIQNRTPCIDVPYPAISAVHRKLPNLFEAHACPWVLLAPGSSAAQAWKRWSADLWAQLVTQVEKAGITSVFTGSRNESPLIADIIQRSGSMNAINTAGQLSLAESAALAKEASTLVCCDSALMHIAAAVGTPVIGLFGPTDEKRTGPVGSHHLLLRSSECKGGCFSLQNPNGHLQCETERCMRGIPFDRVFGAVLERIKSNMNAA